LRSPELPRAAGGETAAGPRRRGRPARVRGRARRRPVPAHPGGPAVGPAGGARHQHGTLGGGPGMRAKPTGLRAIVRALAVVTAAAGATVLMTWPVARQATDHLVVPRDFIGKGLLPTSPDTYLHLWILAWVHHALTRWPTRLFDASIMYPAHNA